MRAGFTVSSPGRGRLAPSIELGECGLPLRRKPTSSPDFRLGSSARTATTKAMSPSAQRSEGRPDLGAEEFRLFPRREVAALVDFVEIDELVIAPFDPASRSWPTMGHDQRHSIVMTRADVDELYVETIDLGDKHWQGIQFRFPLSPVIVRAPIADESLELRQLHALGLMATVSLEGHRVAKTRRRRSSRPAWGNLMAKGRVAWPA